MHETLVSRVDRLERAVNKLRHDLQLDAKEQGMGEDVDATEAQQPAVQQWQVDELSTAFKEAVNSRQMRERDKGYEELERKLEDLQRLRLEALNNAKNHQAQLVGANRQIDELGQKLKEMTFEKNQWQDEAAQSRKLATGAAKKLSSVHQKSLKVRVVTRDLYEAEVQIMTKDGWATVWNRTSANLQDLETLAFSVADNWVDTVG